MKVKVTDGNKLKKSKKNRARKKRGTKEKLLKRIDKVKILDKKRKPVFKNFKMFAFKRKSNFGRIDKEIGYDKDVKHDLNKRLNLYSLVDSNKIVYKEINVEHFYSYNSIGTLKWQNKKDSSIKLLIPNIKFKNSVNTSTQLKFTPDEGSVILNKSSLVPKTTSKMKLRDSENAGELLKGKKFVLSGEWKNVKRWRMKKAIRAQKRHEMNLGKYLEKTSHRITQGLKVKYVKNIKFLWKGSERERRKRKKYFILSQENSSDLSLKNPKDNRNSDTKMRRYRIKIKKRERQNKNSFMAKNISSPRLKRKWEKSFLKLKKISSSLYSFKTRDCRMENVTLLSETILRAENFNEKFLKLLAHQLETFLHFIIQIFDSVCPEINVSYLKQGFKENQEEIKLTYKNITSPGFQKCKRVCNLYMNKEGTRSMLNKCNVRSVLLIHCKLESQTNILLKVFYTAYIPSLLTKLKSTNETKSNFFHLSFKSINELFFYLKKHLNASLHPQIIQLVLPSLKKFRRFPFLWKKFLSLIHKIIFKISTISDSYKIEINLANSNSINICYVKVNSKKASLFNNKTSELRTYCELLNKTLANFFDTCNSLLISQSRKRKETTTKNYEQIKERKNSRKTRNAKQEISKGIHIDSKGKFCIVSNSKIKMYRSSETETKHFKNENIVPLLSHFYMITDKHFEEEIVLTVYVKDINDNSPVFPNETMYGDVQENGPVGK